MDNWKRTLINLLGVITTAATLIVIYFVLYMTGVIKTIDKHVVTEFVIVLVLTTSVKTFWYSSIESTYYSSQEYTDKITATSTEVDKTVTDANDFDEFIKYENINNYNKVIMSKCEGITIENYKYRWFDNIERFLRWFSMTRKDKGHYVRKFIHRVERRAMRVHKLSGSNILSFSTTRYGLTDDRNPVKSAKFWYIMSGMIMSTVLTFITAMLSFSPNPDVDTRAATIKFISYAIQIMYAILQTILNASTTVKRGINTYCNNIITILDKYEAYKTSPSEAKIINYWEVLQNASVIDKSNTACPADINSTC